MWPALKSNDPGKKALKTLSPAFTPRKARLQTANGAGGRGGGGNEECQPASFVFKP